MGLGKDWTWYPPANDRGDLNIVEIPYKVAASRILHLLLTQRGEDFIHPDMGIAPELFSPLSSFSAEYFVYNAKEEITKWNAVAKMGLTALSVDIESPETFRSSIDIVICYSTFSDFKAANTLSFGYWEYTGVKLEGGLELFRQGVKLNGQMFPEF